MIEHSFEQTAKDFIEHLRQAGKKERTLYTYSRTWSRSVPFSARTNRSPASNLFRWASFSNPTLCSSWPMEPIGPERTVAKTVRVFRMMMIWAKETGRIEILPLPKSTPMGHSKIKEEHDDQQQ